MEIYWTKCNQCFIQTWKQWWEMKTVGETAAWARSAENRARRPKVGMTFLAGKQSSPSPPATGLRRALSTPVEVGALPRPPKGFLQLSSAFTTAFTDTVDHKQWKIHIPFNLESIIVHLVMLCGVLVYDANITVGKSKMIVRILGNRRLRCGTTFWGNAGPEEMTR